MSQADTDLRHAIHDLDAQGIREALQAGANPYARGPGQSALELVVSDSASLGTLGGQSVTAQNYRSALSEMLAVSPQQGDMGVLSSCARRAQIQLSSCEHISGVLQERGGSAELLKHQQVKASGAQVLFRGISSTLERNRALLADPQGFDDQMAQARMEGRSAGDREVQALLTAPLPAALPLPPAPFLTAPPKPTPVDEEAPRGAFAVSDPQTGQPYVVPELSLGRIVSRRQHSTASPGAQPANR